MNRTAASPHSMHHAPSLTIMSWTAANPNSDERCHGTVTELSSAPSVRSIISVKLQCFNSIRAVPLISRHTQRLHSKTFQNTGLHRVCLWKMRGENYKGKTTRLGHWYHPCISLFLFIACNPWSLCIYRDISPTSKLHVRIQIKRGHLPLAKRDQASKDINPQELYNHYWTSNENKLELQSESWSKPIHSYLIEKRRGHCCGKAYCLSRVTILCTRYCSLPCNCAPQPVIDLCIDRISTLIAP